jgi:hypothetical protein
LNTNFLGPVPTPGAIVVYAKLEETKENRKWKIKARVCVGDDRIITTAECLTGTGDDSHYSSPNI